MRSIFIPVLLAAVVLPAQAALACPPPPPGWVEPSREEYLERSLTDATDIVYGVVSRSGPRGETSRFKVLHVYRGTASKGGTIEAPAGWGHPVPVCTGMMGDAPSAPVGAYGVIAFRNSSPQLNFIKPEDVQIMIDKGWIRSARRR
jgi:hypothetical protein